MTDGDDSFGRAADPSLSPAERLERANAVLAQWTADSAEESGPLIDRLEALGYVVRGKTRDEIEAILMAPPSRD